MTNPTHTHADPIQPARGTNGKFTRTLEGIERDAEAARLRAEGKSYRQIAAELDIDLHTAHDAVQRAIAQVVAEPAAAVIHFELERLDHGLRRLEGIRKHILDVLAREGEAAPDDEWILKAVDRLIKIEIAKQQNGESRRRLLGADQPAKTQVTGGLTYEIVGISPDDLV